MFNIYDLWFHNSFLINSSYHTQLGRKNVPSTRGVNPMQNPMALPMGMDPMQAKPQGWKVSGAVDR